MTETEEIIDKVKRGANRVLCNYGNYRSKLKEKGIAPDQRGIYIIELTDGEAIVCFNHVDMLPETVRYLEDEREMADDYYVKMVILSRVKKQNNSKLVKYTHIDEKHAIEGKIVTLKDDGDDKGEWLVEKVYDYRTHISYMRERAHDHTRTRKYSDI